MFILIYTFVILYGVLDPIYHLKFTLKIASCLIFSLFVICCFVAFHANDGERIIAFIPFTAVFSCFIAQLLYCRRVFSLYGFYPRLLFYHSFSTGPSLIKGMFVKHPNYNLPKNDADWILTVYAFGGVFFGVTIPLSMEIILTVWK